MPDFVSVLLEDLVFVETLGGVLPGRASRLAVGRLDAYEALVAVSSQREKEKTHTRPGTGSHVS